MLEECERALFVADRENGRVHRFSLINRAYEGAPSARAAPLRPGLQRRAWGFAPTCRLPAEYRAKEAKAGL